MITDDENTPQKETGRKKGALVILLILAAALFMTDGSSLLEQTGARIGLMSDTLVGDMIADIEYNYYYDDIFETTPYLELKQTLTDKPFITYGDFEDYVYGLSQLAGDDFTYFYYDSLAEQRTDYSEIERGDYEDDFTVFRKDGIPVIRFSQFAYETGDRVVSALKELQKSGDRVVVLDLTDNPGGMVDQCITICDALMPEAVIFEEQYNDLSRYQYISDPQMLSFDKIVILLNSESASCSEILALTLKEHLKDKVALIGPETYGKRVTQSVNQDDRLHFSLFLVTAQWSVGGKTTEDLNGYLAPWKKKNIKGFEDGFIEARALINAEGLMK